MRTSDTMGQSGRARRPERAQRGGIYIAVLGSGMLVTLLGLTAMAAMRVQRVTAVTAADAEQARHYALSAVELGAQWVRADPLWRATRTNGVWASNQPIGSGAFTLEGIDPIDGELLNRPTDPLILRATVIHGRARQIVEARLDASGLPLDVLETAIYAPGEFRIRPGGSLTLIGAPAATGGALRNDGTITGDAECLVSTGTGATSGTLTTGALPRLLPADDVFAMYAALGVEISPGATISRRLLAPGANPWGAMSPEGVYVIRSSEDITISDSRIHGTLVIQCPGRTVTISGNVLMHAARADYPVLLVDGNLVLDYASATQLSESAVNVNLNPPAAPYEGMSNNTKTDTYPSEIRGLVHVRGTLQSRIGSPHIRGGVIVEAADASSAIDIESPFRITHDSDFISRPPMGYTNGVEMTVTPGTWKQVVLP